jgi:hypothetical protein
MTKQEAITRDVARDGERREVYAYGRRGRDSAMVAISERYLVLLVDALRNYHRASRLGDLCVQDREALITRLIGEMEPHQEEAATMLATLDITYFEEWSSSDR